MKVIIAIVAKGSPSEDREGKIVQSLLQRPYQRSGAKRFIETEFNSVLDLMTRGSYKLNVFNSLPVLLLAEQKGRELA